MKILPQGTRVYILLDAHKSQAGSIILPEKHSERSRIATVMGVGGDVTRYKVGDRGLVSWYVGVIMNIPGMDMREDHHRMCSEDEILAKVEE